MSSTNILAPALPTQAGDIHTWGNLHGSSVSLAIATVADRHTGPVLVVVDSNESAERLRRELGFFWIKAENAEDMQCMYISSEFDSFRSLLRYIKDNKINYLFTMKCLIPDIEGIFHFSKNKEKIEFIENKIDNKINDHDWYGEWRS